MREQFAKLLQTGNATRVADLVRASIQARKDEADWKQATREMRGLRRTGSR